ncbi:MAG: efflux RND transporter permease subunit [Bacteroidaceae bacterium]|nr:efflux RND transporter permease subunit [Bacteroidaceae bacterium]
MKNLIRIAVGNPVTILMMVLAIGLLGKISYDKLSVDLLPDLNNPKLFVEINAGERPPEEVEKQFVQRMESMAIRGEDVVGVSSVIKAGTARMTVEYAWNKDMDEAFLDLQKAMNSFSQDDAISELKITQNDPNTDPIMLVGMSHQSITNMAELRKVADSYVRNELVRVEGIADVILSGDEVSRLVIKTDPYRLDAYGLSTGTLSSKIQEENQRISGGRVTEMGTGYIVSGVNMLATEEDFGNIIVGYKETEANGGGSVAVSSEFAPISKAPIYMRDVADIYFENSEPDNIVRINGMRCIGLSIYKEMRFNTVHAVAGVTERLNEIEKALPGYRFDVVSNQGTFITESIGEVKNSAVLGVILAVIVLYVFLRRVKVTLIISLAIPISIIATFNLMYFGGLTLNIMTLGGLALGAGMLVDNAIVVIESIFRNQEKGLGLKDAVIQGTSEVGSAVIASTLTTIVVFLPIVYLQGASGELFKDQAWTVTFSLVSSLFVAILVIPTLYERIFRKQDTTKSKGEQSEDEYVPEGKLVGWYSQWLVRILDNRWMVVIGSVVLVIGTCLILPFIGTEFMPKAESNSLSIQVRMNEGTRLNRTAQAVAGIEELIFNLTQDSMCVVYSHIGPGETGGDEIFEGENTARMKVLLSPQSQCSPEKLTELLSAYTQDVEGLELAFLQEESSLGALLGSEDAPVVVEIKGEELDEMANITEIVKERMMQIDGLFNVMSSVEDGAPEMVLTVNRAIAGMNNLNVSSIVSQIQEQLSGISAGQMDYKGEMRDIMIQVPDITLSQLSGMTITGGEQKFRLLELVDIRKDVAPKEIYRRNQNRIAKVTAGLEDGYSLSEVATVIRESLKDIELPVNYGITVTGEEEKRQESMGGLVLALVLSVILVYMVMASQFESLLHPFTILLTIPLALVGAVLLFFVTGTTINIMGVIGVIMLSGIAVNNSIILVDRINQIKGDYDRLTDAIVVAASQRIRPILMTSLTTILSLLPMAITFGEGASLRAPMAIAVIGGLVTSTFLSLVVIPCVYYLLEQMKRKVMG